MSLTARCLAVQPRERVGRRVRATVSIKCCLDRPPRDAAFCPPCYRLPPAVTLHSLAFQFASFTFGQTPPHRSGTGNSLSPCAQTPSGFASIFNPLDSEHFLSDEVRRLTDSV